MVLVLIAIFISILCGCDDSSSSGDEKSTSSSEAEALAWYKDADGDGFGDSDTSLTQSGQPAGYVKKAGDCNDYDEEVYPDAPELCDGKDNNCDGETDEGACDFKQIEITGNIENLAALEEYAVEEAYLQLVSMPESEETIDYTADSQGRLVCLSELASIEIPSTDFFEFETEGLLPGTYVVAVQGLESYDTEEGVLPILSASADEFAIVDVPLDYMPPLQIELGKVFVPLPEPIERVQDDGADAQNVGAPPETPGVSASDGDYTDKVRVTWNTAEGATSYELYRAESYVGNKIKLTTTAETRFDDKTVPCGESYYYWVRAGNSYGTSSFFYSDLGYRKCPVPPAPVNLSASDGDYENRVRLRWDGVSEASGYDIYRAVSSGGAKTLIGSVKTTGYDDTSAGCGVSYYYWIKAVNSTGESGLSSYAEGSLSCSNGGGGSTSIGSLPTPTGLSATDGDFAGKIRLKWSPSSGAAGYDIYRAPQICGVKRKIGSAASNIFDDTSVPNRAIYYYWVKATSSAGESEYCNYDTGHLMRIPSPPTGVSASDGKYVDKILVKWNAVNNATSYDIYRADWPKGEKTKIGTTSSTSIYDNTVECSSCKTGICGPKDYTYFVKARNDAGVSPFSDYDTGYVYITLRDPNNVSASDGSYCCVYVAWESVSGAKSYKIYRASSLEGAKTLVGTRIAETSCERYVYRDSTVTCPIVYYYWVKAVDSKGHTSCTYGEPDNGYCEGCSDLN